MPASVCDGDLVYIAPWGPPIVAFVASVVRGLTGFGDGITYQSLWSLLGALGALPSNSCPAILRKTVLFAVLMQCLTMPMQLWQARRLLRTIAGYASLMALSGAACVVGGAEFLLNGDPTGVRMVAGCIFLLFSVWQITTKFTKALRARSDVESAEDAQLQDRGGPSLEARETPSAATAPSEGEQRTLLHAAALSASDTSLVTAGTVESDVESSGEMSEAPAVTPPAAAIILDGMGPAPRIPADLSAAARTGPGAVDDLEGRRCGCITLPPTRFPRLSPGYPPVRMLALLLPASMLGGLLGGLTGAGGPPLMASYSLLSLDKDVLRGFGVVPSVFMLVRLAMYTGAPGAVFDPSPQGDLWVYCGIFAAAVAGSLLGDRLRPRFNSDAIIAMVLVLVFVGSGLMLRLFQDTGVTVFYGVLTAGWCSVAVLCWTRPDLARRLGCMVARKRQLPTGMHSASVVAGLSSPATMSHALDAAAAIAAAHKERS